MYSILIFPTLTFFRKIAGRLIRNSNYGSKFKGFERKNMIYIIILKKYKINNYSFFRNDLVALKRADFIDWQMMTH